MFVRWMDVDQAFAEAEALRRRVDAVLGRRGLDGRHGLTALRRAPGPEVSEDETGFTLALDVPGARRDDVDLSVEDHVLKLVVRREVQAPEGAKARHRERSPYEVRRAFRLPDTVDTEAIDASLSDGVLSVRLAKRPEAGPRRIEVQS